MSVIIKEVKPNKNLKLVPLHSPHAAVHARVQTFSGTRGKEAVEIPLDSKPTANLEFSFHSAIQDGRQGVEAWKEEAQLFFAVCH